MTRLHRLRRALSGEGEPKYLNSPETKLFDRARNLYGLNFARTSRTGYMLVCEGYMDVIAMHQASFTDAVASLGTAFTYAAYLPLKRYTTGPSNLRQRRSRNLRRLCGQSRLLKEAGCSVKVLDMKPLINRIDL